MLTTVICANLIHDKQMSIERYPERFGTLSMPVRKPIKFAKAKTAVHPWTNVSFVDLLIFDTNAYRILVGPDFIPSQVRQKILRDKPYHHLNFVEHNGAATTKLPELDLPALTAPVSQNAPRTLYLGNSAFELVEVMQLLLEQATTTCCLLRKARWFNYLSMNVATTRRSPKRAFCVRHAGIFIHCTKLITRCPSEPP
jgi:hypothetical protein